MPDSSLTEILVAREIGGVPDHANVKRLQISSAAGRESLTTNYTYDESREVGHVMKDRTVIYADHGGTVNTYLFPWRRLDDLLASAIRSESYEAEWPVAVQPIRQIWDGHQYNKVIVQKQIEDSSSNLVYQIYRDCVVTGVVFNLGTDLDSLVGVSLSGTKVEISDTPLLAFPDNEIASTTVEYTGIDQAYSSDKFHTIHVDRIILTFANAFSYRRGIGKSADPAGIKLGRLRVRGYLQGRFDSEITLEEAASREEGRIGFVVRSSLGHQYNFYLPRIRIDNSSVISGAASAPVVARIDFFALEKGVSDESIVRISRRT